MNRVHASSLMLVLFASATAFAATEVNPSLNSTSLESPQQVSVQTAPEMNPITSERKTLLTVELTGGSNQLDMNISGNAGPYTVNSSAEMSGGSAINGVSMGITQKISRTFGIEGNFGFSRKSFSEMTVNGQAIGEPEDTMKISSARLTGMGRFYPTPGFSFGAGAFTSSFVGNYQVTSTSTGESTSHSFSDSGLNRFDYGAAFGARGEIPISPSVALTLDLRYFLGLANLADQQKTSYELNGFAPEDVNFDTTLKTRDLQFGAGIGFLF